MPENFTRSAYSSHRDKRRTPVRGRNRDTVKAWSAIEAPDAGSRFDGWRRRPAIVVLALVGLLIIYGILTSGSVHDAPKVPDGGRTDTDLYSAIIARVHDGENFYSAAADEQRAGGYPLRPAIVVREPTLAYAGAVLGGSTGLQRILIALGAIMSIAMIERLERLAPGRYSWWASVVLTGLFASSLFEPTYSVLHEAWAAMLILLALLSRSLPTFWPSVIFGFLAVAVRELALPLLVVMAFFAWREGKSNEAKAWLAAIALFVLGYAAHMALVLSVTGATDPESQGWLRFGAWSFDLSTVRSPTVLSFAPAWVTAVVVPLALLGWASRRSEIATRVVALLALYFLAFFIIGRPENWYWGILYVSLIGGGLAFAPSALVALIRASRSTVQTQG